MRKYPGKKLVRSQFLLALFAFFLLYCSTGAQAAKKAKENPKDEVTALQIVVTGGTGKKPIDNASVYLHWDEPRFLRHAKQMEFDLKTDMKGVAVVKDVPRRRILIQVVKENWRPFGRYYDLAKPEQKIEIELQPPPHWY